jgi:hypothetical protein
MVFTSDHIPRRRLADRTRSEQLTLAAFVVLVLLAGGNGVGVDIARDELGAYWGAWLRFAVSACIFAVLMVAFRIPMPSGGACSPRRHQRGGNGRGHRSAAPAVLAGG